MRKRNMAKTSLFASFVLLVSAGLFFRQWAIRMEHPRYLFIAKSQNGSISFFERDGRLLVQVKDFDGDGIVDELRDYRITKEPLYFRQTDSPEKDIFFEIARRNSHQRAMILTDISGKFSYIDVESFLRRFLSTLRGSGNQIDLLRMSYWSNT